MAIGKVQTHATIAGLTSLLGRTPTAMELAMYDTVRYAHLFTRLYLRGPRPAFLSQRSHRLANSIGYEVESNSRRVTGYIGTNVKSAKGFNYPEYWETRGTIHGGPRPFLKPTVYNHQAQIQTMHARRLAFHLKNQMKGVAK